MPDYDVAADREIIEKATPGPWAWEQYGEKSNNFHVGIAVDKHDQPVYGQTETMPYDEDKDLFVEEIIWHDSIGDSQETNCNYDDAAFICAARTRWPAALEEIERLQEKVREAVPLVECALRSLPHDRAAREWLSSARAALGKEGERCKSK